MDRCPCSLSPAGSRGSLYRLASPGGRQEARRSIILAKLIAMCFPISNNKQNSRTEKGKKVGKTCDFGDVCIVRACDFSDVKINGN